MRFPAPLSALSCLLMACGGAAPPATSAPAPTAVAPPAVPRTLAGGWHGSLGAGADKLRVVITFVEKDGTYTGELHSLDQHAKLPIDRVTLDGDRLRFEIARIGGSYEGRLDTGRRALAGTWTQGGAAQPLALVLDGPDDPAPPKQPPVRPIDAPIDVAVSTPPVLVRVGDGLHLVYELHVTNVASRELTLKRVEILDAERKSTASTYEGASLIEQTVRFGEPGAEGAVRTTLGPGQRGVLFAWVDVKEAPKSIEHRVTVSLQGHAEDFSVSLPKISVDTAAPLVVGPPLEGGDWLAGNGPSASSNHRHALIPIGGAVHVAQRFAIDWVKVKDDKTFAGDAKKNSSYYAYGASALAVAEGKVVAIKDGIEENVPGEIKPPTLERVAGNYVVLDLGKGHFGFYAHLQPGSLRVKVGERVRRGQVLGLVGNSGNSTEPHLHMHVSNAASPLGAEGVPYAFDRVSVRKSKQTEWKVQEKQLPGEDDVVRFAEAKR